MRCLWSAALLLSLSLAIIPPGLAAGRKASQASGAATIANALDRVAYAVDGAESSHGADIQMWRADPAGPQGPMQVSEAAAVDVGGGDRFDPDQNREMGRAYLAQLYHRYGDWPDAIAAYNWGIGNLNAWVKAGRPIGGLEFAVGAYLDRVLHDSGLCDATGPRAHRAVSLVPSDCADLAAWSVLLGSGGFVGGGATRFHRQLDAAMQMALAHAHSR